MDVVGNGLAARSSSRLGQADVAVLFQDSEGCVCVGGSRKLAVECPLYIAAGKSPPVANPGQDSARRILTRVRSQPTVGGQSMISPVPRLSYGAGHGFLADICFRAKGDPGG
jgi:hypothetical protein